VRFLHSIFPLLSTFFYERLAQSQQDDDNTHVLLQSEMPCCCFYCCARKKKRGKYAVRRKFMNKNFDCVQRLGRKILRGKGSGIIIISLHQPDALGERDFYSERSQKMA
jgi:hypothetical protein